MLNLDECNLSNSLYNFINNYYELQVSDVRLLYQYHPKC